MRPDFLTRILVTPVVGVVTYYLGVIIAYTVLEPAIFAHLPTYQYLAHPMLLLLVLVLGSVFGYTREIVASQVPTRVTAFAVLAVAAPAVLWIAGLALRLHPHPALLFGASVAAGLWTGSELLFERSGGDRREVTQVKGTRGG